MLIASWYGHGGNAQGILGIGPTVQGGQFLQGRGPRFGVQERAGVNQFVANQARRIPQGLLPQDTRPQFGITRQNTNQFVSGQSQQIPQTLLPRQTQPQLRQQPAITNQFVRNQAQQLPSGLLPQDTRPQFGQVRQPIDQFVSQQAQRLPSRLLPQNTQPQFGQVRQPIDQFVSQQAQQIPRTLLPSDQQPQFRRDQRGQGLFGVPNAFLQALNNGQGPARGGQQQQQQQLFAPPRPLRATQQQQVQGRPPPQFFQQGPGFTADNLFTPQRPQQFTPQRAQQFLSPQGPPPRGPPQILQPVQRPPPQTAQSPEDQLVMQFGSNIADDLNSFFGDDNFLLGVESSFDFQGERARIQALLPKNETQGGPSGQQVGGPNGGGGPQGAGGLPTGTQNFDQDTIPEEILDRLPEKFSKPIRERQRILKEQRERGDAPPPQPIQQRAAPRPLARPQLLPTPGQQQVFLVVEQPVSYQAD